MRHLTVVCLVLLLVGCGGGSSTSPSASTPVAVTPTPAPTPTPTPAPTYNVTGYWKSEARSWNFNLSQSGTSIRGTLTGFKNETYPDLNDPALQITGTITSAGKVSFSCPLFSLSFDGYIETGNARMTGTLYDCVNNNCRNYGEILVKH
jgi:hypothetical protein